MESLITHQFRQGDLVYLTHDPDQYLRQVVYLQIHINGIVKYGLACGSEVSEHNEFELSHTPRPTPPDEIE